jgi:hypothetical protein
MISEIMELRNSDSLFYLPSWILPGFGYFWNMISLYAWAGLDLDSHIYASLHSCNDKHVPLCPVIG